MFAIRFSSTDSDHDRLENTYKGYEYCCEPTGGGGGVAVGPHGEEFWRLDAKRDLKIYIINL